MIQLNPRTDVLLHCPALAKYMLDWQQAEYEEMQEDTDEDELADFRQLTDDVTITYPHSLIGEQVYKLEADNIYDYVQLLSDKVFLLADLMGWQALSFIALYKTPWLQQQNAYPPVAAELKYLQSIGVNMNCTDAITATGVELKRVLKTIFWLGRCNALLPYIHFAATGADWVFYICKYGYLHVYSYQNQALIDGKLKEAGFSLYTGMQEDFLEGGAMIGRL
ncbi:hypothetical protein CAP35_00750 [Chitinophagaceae bacterium IBVUCB1]|nr:hypothetical protein CAP35_00750 [Chitinophagaceae bacterium IBVUCB1]